MRRYEGESSLEPVWVFTTSAGCRVEKYKAGKLYEVLDETSTIYGARSKQIHLHLEGNKGKCAFEATNITEAEQLLSEALRHLTEYLTLETKQDIRPYFSTSS